MAATQWRRGVAWKDSKFYAFEPNSVVVMRLWPDMLAWRRTPKRPWSPTRKWADRVLCSSALEPGYLERFRCLRDEFGGPLCPFDTLDRFKLALEASMVAFGTIPERERRIAVQFRERRWHVLALMARCPGAADLLEANPALGYALASSWVLRDAPVTQPMRSARALVTKPQAHILAWLGFEPSERVRRILRRVDPAVLNGRMLPGLQRGLSCPQVQAALAHLPKVCAEVLPFVMHRDAMQRLTPGFLLDVQARAANRDLSEGDFRDTAFRLWCDALRMAFELQAEPPAVLRSFRQIERWHDELVQRYNHLAPTERARRIDFDGDLVFPPAPFSDRPGVEALVTHEALLEEGRTMAHCVGSYGSAVAAGRYAVYRVTEPCRATLGLVRTPYGWAVDQLKGPRNRRIGASEQAQVVRSLMRQAPGAAHV